MNEHWLEVLLGVAMALLAWIGKRLHDRVDEHDRNHVTREELDKTITRFHEENRDNLQYIRERVDAIADRQGRR